MGVEIEWTSGRQTVQGWENLNDVDAIKAARFLWGAIRDEPEVVAVHAVDKRTGQSRVTFSRGKRTTA